MIEHHIAHKSVRVVKVPGGRNKIVETLTLEDGSTVKLPDDEVSQNFRMSFSYFWWGCLSVLLLALAIALPHFIGQAMRFYFHV
jgi:hypothetical protein